MLHADDVVKIEVNRHKTQKQRLISTSTYRNYREEKGSAIIHTGEGICTTKCPKAIKWKTFIADNRYHIP
jgi:hypothetical protein